MTTAIFVEATSRIGALTLRPWARADSSSLIDAYRDPVLRRWTRIPVTDTAEAQHWLELQQAGWDNGERFSFAVDETTSTHSSLVANVVLKTGHLHTGCAEVGYWTAAEARGRGIAPRALTALTGWAVDTFGPRGLTHLQLRHETENQASCRVADKAGYPFHSTIYDRPPSTRRGHLHQMAAEMTHALLGRVLPAR